jgi:hypothetical protein
MSLIFTDEQRKEFKRAAEEKYAAKEKEFLRTAKIPTAKYYQNIPVRYRKPWLKAYLGEANKRQVIAAMCYNCAGYEDTQANVGNCNVTLCPLFKYRPLQKGKVKCSQPTA